ncbi:MAG: hypothetical protein KBD90_03270 [Alphaproteobacteria bacterium]|nr:hypothetical protein [Alphaproteobacteria bacterium]
MTQVLHHMNNGSFAPQYLPENRALSRGRDMASPSPSSPSLRNELPGRARKAKVAMLREEFFDLTQDPWIATVLNQLFYWSQRVSDFDLFLEEEKTCHSKSKESAQYGWFYKSATELSEETMLRVTKVTMRKYLHFLIERGWLSERTNPHYKWDRTSQYRLNFTLLERDLQKLGWDLPGFPNGRLESFSQEFSCEEKEEEIQVKVQELLNLEKHSSKESFSTLEGKANDTSKESSLTFDEKANDTSKLSSLTFEGKANETSRESSLAFEGKVNDTSKLSSLTFEGKANDTSKLSSLTFDEKANDTSKLSSLTFEGKANDTSKESFLTFDGKANDTSKVEKVNLLTETTTETINREHTQRTRVREADQKNGNVKKSDGWKSLGSLTSLAIPEASEGLGPPASASLSQILEQMMAAWKAHMRQEVRLTLGRKNRLQSVLRIYFQDDLSQWTQFCKRVGSSPFLMGQGARKWRVSLDWVLLHENLLKVLEGNFDDPAAVGQKQAEESKASRAQEISSVLDAISDPVWKEWCSQLDLSCESQDSVSLWELKEMVPARFLETEDDRLVWIGSSDARALSRIENLKLKILPVAQRTFPQARTLRTRLFEEALPLQPEVMASDFLQQKTTQQKGENHAE